MPPCGGIHRILPVCYGRSRSQRDQTSIRVNRETLAVAFGEFVFGETVLGHLETQAECDLVALALFGLLFLVDDASCVSSDERGDLGVLERFDREFLAPELDGIGIVS